VAQRHPEADVIIPPRSTAVSSDDVEIAPTQCDRHRLSIAEHGRIGWQTMSGHKRRALVETAISRFKQVIGDGLRSRTNQRRATEVAIAVHALNRMLELGRPKSVRIAQTKVMGSAQCAHQPIRATRSRQAIPLLAKPVSSAHLVRKLRMVMEDVARVQSQATCRCSR